MAKLNEIIAIKGVASYILQKEDIDLDGFNEILKELDVTTIDIEEKEQLKADISYYKRELIHTKQALDALATIINLHPEDISNISDGSSGVNISKKCIKISKQLSYTEKGFNYTDFRRRILDKNN